MKVIQLRVVTGKLTRDGDILAQRHSGNPDGVFAKNVATDFDIPKAVERKHRFKNFIWPATVCGVQVLTPTCHQMTVARQCLAIAHSNERALGYVEVRARELRRPPAVIEAAAQGASREQQMMTGYYAGDIAGLPEMGLVARQLYETAGIGPDDIQTAVIYDHFTPFVLVQLEEFGFCARGEAKDFVRDGNIELGGRLPINTHGGQIGEAYIHGMNGVSEAVRQIRGTAVNAVKDVERVLVTAGTGVPTSALILGVD